MRGAPVLIGRIGWEPGDSAEADNQGMGSTLRWTLIGLGAMFFISLVRWLIPLRRIFTRPGANVEPRTIVKDELDPGHLDAWVQSVTQEPGSNDPNSIQS